MAGLGLQVGHLLLHGGQLGLGRLPLALVEQRVPLHLEDLDDQQHKPLRW